MIRMIDVRCYNRQRAYGARELFPVIRETAEYVLYSSPFIRRLLEEGIGVCIDVTTVGPRIMRKINREQRSVDALTDVLSFPAHNMREGALEKPLDPWQTFAPDDRSALYLGELVISPERAAEQAKNLEHTLERELMFLTIHGVLHLLGFDHECEEDALTMKALQRQLIRGLEEVPSGFVALCGRPNVGKSTLLNRLSGRTLAIESPKPQTTRHAIRSVLFFDDAEIAFLDMPGLHKPNNALGRAMMKTAMQSIRQADIIALMIDASWRPYIGEEECRVLEIAKEDNKKTILLINKIDRSPKEAILPLIALYDANWHPDACIPISAKTGDGLDIFIDEIKRLLPVRRRMFQEVDETDQTDRILAAELVRREILRQTEQEIPYGVAVTVRSFDEEMDESGERAGILIEADIICERSSHKKVLVGKGGSMVRSIGTEARKAMEMLFNAPVYLNLFVRVRPNWQNRPQDLGAVGLLPSDTSI